ncbi:hypothetical protein CK203_095199 [Vitis vinifera]|uniref:Endonuclease/exonuclease/phosphatase domain-containing protein n=1 Tax=Vitis vinifera TaxID=29760 RepID=A0A438E111_VITVI|nr:hypothetical protein CK203_095199 [Vitis vinifera]
MPFAGQRVSAFGSPMKLKLLSWNVRGANGSSKRKIIKAFIRKQKVDLLCIQETKFQSMIEGVVRSLGTGRFLDWRALDASGSTGDSGMWKMALSGCSREFMVRSLKKKGNACGRSLGRLEEFGKNPGV